MADIYIPSTRGIVKQLLRLASDPENHDYIFKEAGALPRLASFHSLPSSTFSVGVRQD